MAARAVDPDARLSAHDLQVQHTLSCPFGHTHQAQAALDHLPQQFTVKQQVSIACSAVHFSQQATRAVTRGILHQLLHMTARKEWFGLDVRNSTQLPPG